MSDSISIIGWINRDLTDAQYKKCRFPKRDSRDTDQASADFRTFNPISPLTGAGFKVTPLGMPIPGTSRKGSVLKNRYLHGRIAGYLVEVNVPACVIGHNRLLANSAPAAASVAFWLLKYWLALNGCTEEGLDQFKFSDAADLDEDYEDNDATDLDGGKTGSIDIVSVSLPFLLDCRSEKAARSLQAEFQAHAEAILNTSDADKGPAYRIPKERPADPDAKDTYTSYVRHREFKFKGYVKELNQPNATMLPIEDRRIEAEVQDIAVGAFRLEGQVHEKWLRDNKLNKVAHWRKPAGTTEVSTAAAEDLASLPEKYVSPYEKVFELIRDMLQLDGKFRPNRLKKTTVKNLPLSERDKQYLLYHLNDQVVRNHPDFWRMDAKQRSYRYSDLRRRIKKEIRIDFNIPFKVQITRLSENVADRLDYEREYEPPEHLAGYVFSPTSFHVVIRKLKAIVADVLEYGPASFPPVPKNTVYNGPGKPKRRGSGISDAPIAKESPEDDPWGQ